MELGMEHLTLVQNIDILHYWIDREVANLVLSFQAGGKKTTEDIFLYLMMPGDPIKLLMPLLNPPCAAGHSQWWLNILNPVPHSLLHLLSPFSV